LPFLYTAGANAVVKSKLDAFFDLAHRLVGLDRGDVHFFDSDASLLRLTQDQWDAAFSAASGSANGTVGLRILLTESLGDEGIRGRASISGGPLPDTTHNTVVVDFTEAEGAIDTAADLQSVGISSQGAFAVTLDVGREHRGASLSASLVFHGAAMYRPYAAGPAPAR
jgi:hypothetical protein